MTMLSFPNSRRYGGHSIEVPVTFVPEDGPMFVVNAILDTGASLSVFDKGIASALGIADITSGILTPLEVANGAKDDGYAFDLPVAVLGRSVMATVVFVPNWPDGLTNLLGMRGFLDRFGGIAINHRIRMLYY